MKKCPFCAEPIQSQAIKCKHCGEMLQEPGAPKPPKEMSETEKKIAKVIAGVIAASVVIAWVGPVSFVIIPLSLAFWHNKKHPTESGKIGCVPAGLVVVAVICGLAWISSFFHPTPPATITPAPPATKASPSPSQSSHLALSNSKAEAISVPAPVAVATVWIRAQNLPSSVSMPLEGRLQTDTGTITAATSKEALGTAMHTGLSNECVANLHSMFDDGTLVHVDSGTRAEILSSDNAADAAEVHVLEGPFDNQALWVGMDFFEAPMSVSGVGRIVTGPEYSSDDVYFVEPLSCSGTIISTGKIEDTVTLRHSFVDDKPNDWEIRLGTPCLILNKTVQVMFPGRREERRIVNYRVRVQHNGRSEEGWVFDGEVKIGKAQ